MPLLTKNMENQEELKKNAQAFFDEYMVLVKRYKLEFSTGVKIGGKFRSKLANWLLKGKVNVVWSIVPFVDKPEAKPESVEVK